MAYLVDFILLARLAITGKGLLFKLTPFAISLALHRGVLSVDRQMLPPVPALASRTLPLLWHIHLGEWDADITERKKRFLI